MSDNHKRAMRDNVYLFPASKSGSPSLASSNRQRYINEIKDIIRGSIVQDKPSRKPQSSKLEGLVVRLEGAVDRLEQLIQKED